MQGGLGNLRSQLISAEQQLSALRADIRVGMASAADVSQPLEEALFETRLTDAKKVRLVDCFRQLKPGQQAHYLSCLVGLDVDHVQQAVVSQMAFGK